MPKQGIHISQIGPFLKTQSAGWVLSVGAGTSTPIFPTWDALVGKLGNQDKSIDNSDEVIKSLRKLYSPESVIEAAKARLQLGEEKFIDLLSQLLYEDVRKGLLKKEWDLFTKHLSIDPGELERNSWLEFVDLIENKFPQCSAIQIAKIIVKTIDKNIPPKAIFSFNAEPLLAALINAYTATSVRSREKVIDLIIHSIANRRSNRIGYFFSHGLLPVPSQVKKRRILSSVDVVFSEHTYLQMANQTFSWQATSFLATASAVPIVFIGTSLSDPNVRRWLSWTHTNRVRELSMVQSHDGDSSHHFWLNRKPNSADKMRWLEASVARLGVRLVWIDDWDQIGLALKRMLAL